MLEIYAAIKTLLTGTVTLNSVVVPYHVSTFTRGTDGIYISSYSERENGMKHIDGANVDLTITCFTNSTPDDCQSISAQVEAIIKPNISSVMTLANEKVTVMLRAGKVHTVPLIDGQEINQIELNYSFIIN